MHFLRKEAFTVEEYRRVPVFVPVSDGKYPALDGYGSLGPYILLTKVNIYTCNEQCYNFVTFL